MESLGNCIKEVEIFIVQIKGLRLHFCEVKQIRNQTYYCKRAANGVLKVQSIYRSHRQNILALLDVELTPLEAVIAG